MRDLPDIAGSERLVVIVGASGAGKDSVMAAWRERLRAKSVHFAQRVITRPPEGNEAHEAVSPAQFERAVTDGEFATWWAANGLRYAVRWRELRPLQAAQWVVVNGSRAHLATLRLQAPHLKSVEITADTQVRKRRLAARGRENLQAVTERLRREVPATVDLHVCNNAALSVAVGQLHTWWNMLLADQRQSLHSGAAATASAPQ